jgi:hypothetical protein
VVVALAAKLARIIALLRSGQKFKMKAATVSRGSAVRAQRDRLDESVGGGSEMA